MRRASDRTRSGIFLAAAFLLALALRLSSLPAATAGGLRLLSPDCYGHLRRSTFVARNFPRVPVRDPYMNPPEGGVWIWPPAFDFLLGGVSRLLFGPRASIDDVALVSAWVPPFLGALQVVPLFFLARRALGRHRARIAVASYAVLPSAVLWSAFGHADQHVAEALALLLFLSAASRAVSMRRAPHAPRRAVLLGAALALAILVWQGAVFIAGVGLPWAALALGPLSAWAGASATLLTAAATVLAAGRQALPFTFVSFGWFQPAFLGLFTLLLALLAAVRVRERAPRVWFAALAALLLAVCAPSVTRIAGMALRGGAYVFTSDRGGRGAEMKNGGYLFYPSDTLHVVAESQPLLGAPIVDTLGQAVSGLSLGLILLPFALFLWASPTVRAALRRRRIPPRAATRLLLAAFGATLLVMTLFQRRSVYYLGIFTALALAEGIGRLLLGRRRGILAPCLAVVLVAVPGAWALKRVTFYMSSPGHDVLDVMRRLRTLDPPGIDPASDPLPAPGSIPAVMAPWAAGHFVTALAERPAAADPFFYGWRRQCRFFTATDDIEAREILRQAGCRYVITTDLRSVLPLYARAAGRSETDPAAMLAVRVHESASMRPVPFLVRVLDSRTSARMPDGRLVPRFRVFRVEPAD